MKTGAATKNSKFKGSILARLVDMDTVNWSRHLAGFIKEKKCNSRFRQYEAHQVAPPT